MEERYNYECSHYVAHPIIGFCDPEDKELGFYMEVSGEVVIFFSIQQFIIDWFYAKDSDNDKPDPDDYVFYIAILDTKMFLSLGFTFNLYTGYWEKIL
jgi:hypothetical protein